MGGVAGLTKTGNTAELKLTRKFAVTGPRKIYNWEPKICNWSLKIGNWDLFRANSSSAQFGAISKTNRLERSFHLE